jgi:hypothetical protein
MALPNINSRLSQSELINMKEGKVEDTISTECQSPDKLPSSSSRKRERSEVEPF